MNDTKKQVKCESCKFSIMASASGKVYFCDHPKEKKCGTRFRNHGKAFSCGYGEFYE